MTGSGQYDYIIIGAGSAGCVMAYRLSMLPGVRILVLEAGGPDSNPLLPMPLAIGKTLTDPNLCWFYQTEPEPRADDQPYVWLRGKVVGGSSSVNGMLYFHGQPEDYDSWLALGCDGWGWDDMARCFREMEDHQLGPGPWRGTGGPLSISVDRQRSPLTEAVIEAGGGMGIPRKADVNDPDQLGIGYSPATIRKGRRVSAAEAFLRPAMKRGNVDLVTGAMVERLIVEGGDVVGVRAVGGQEYRTHGEVILCAGALQSPALLQLSGIGPAEHLRSLGIKVVADRPDVGRNLREHKSIAMNVALTGPYSHNTRLNGWRLALEAARYALRRPSSLSSTYEVTAFLKTLPELAQPDAELMMWAVTSMFENGQMKPEPHPAMLLCGYPLRTESAGNLAIRSTDPSVPPRIEANFMTTDYDRAVTIRLFRFMRAFLRRPELAPFIREETLPGSAVETDDQIIDYCLRTPTCLHAVGTCRMGGDADSVVDSRARVRGVNGLRVVDSSVMPTQVSGNTQGPVMATSWRAADFIVSARNNREDLIR